MKKFTYLLAAAAVMAACNGNKGYTVTGTVEGAADGDTVYLKMAEGRQLVSLDSAVIANGTFTFKGVQDTVANRYITYAAQDKEPLMIDFFLGKRTNQHQPDARQRFGHRYSEQRHLPDYPHPAQRPERTNHGYLRINGHRHNPYRRAA